MNFMNEITTYAPLIYIIRGVPVMLDSDVSRLYQTTTRLVNLARKRKIKVLGDLSFKLTKKEFHELAKKHGIKINNSYNPIVYTEEACYKLSSYLNSPAADYMLDLMYKAFKAVKDKTMIPVENSPQLLELSNKINTISEQMKGFSQPIVNNHFHAQVNYIHGNHNQLNIGTSDEVIIKLASLIMDNQVLAQKELVELISDSISLANKKEKSGLLDNLKKIVDIGSGMTSISSGVPAIIDMVKKLF